MNRALLLLSLLGLLATAGSTQGQAQRPAIPVVVSKPATGAERLAAQDLLAMLQRIHPQDRFVLADTLPPSSPCILGGNVATDIEIQKRVSRDQFAGAESYVVTNTTEGPRQLGIIAGADPRGVACGNNPMVSYIFSDKTKPVGYLSTTVQGRDWSTMHVNDVRRLWGGEVITQAVFGADAALVPDDQRAAAAQKLMQAVFADAAGRAMDVYFADDVDTLSANPQDLIQTLPAEARFATGGGKLWLANPETAEGYRYYRTQVETLLKTYPHITTLVAWFRGGGTPWLDLKLAEMPPSWQAEYPAELARTPQTAPLWHAPQMFALGKVVRAFDRALQETGATTFTRPQSVAAGPGVRTTDDEEICRTGIQSDSPIGLTLRPILTHSTPSQPATLPAGHYRLRRLFLDPTSTAPGQRVFTVQVTPVEKLLRSSAPAPAADRIDIFQESKQADRILERTYPVALDTAGEVAVTLTPIQGQALICGAVLEPLTQSTEDN
jgi:hypothetical protein